jgi:cytochrome P450
VAQADNMTQVFTVVFIMRFVPAFLQSTVVWLLPWKWSLVRSWKTIQRVVVPEIERRRREAATSAASQDAISWMVKDGKPGLEQDPHVLGKLVGALTGGATYSTAGLVSGVMGNLAVRPVLLGELRDEIQCVHDQIGGRWTKEHLNNLPKLDSVMKETARLTPAAMVLYSRHVEADFTLSTGLAMRRGDNITTVPSVRSMSPEIYGGDPAVFDGLRHLGGQPFRRVDHDVLTWGSGRWACPGRFVANTIGKLVLVRLIQGYDWQLVGGRQLSDLEMHEFALFNPFTRIEFRRRDGVKNEVVG